MARFGAAWGAERVLDREVLYARFTWSGGEYVWPNAYGNSSTLGKDKAVPFSASDAMDMLNHRFMCR